LHDGGAVTRVPVTGLQAFEESRCPRDVKIVGANEGVTSLGDIRSGPSLTVPVDPRTFAVSREPTGITPHR
jgi:hypothetical protein